MIRLLIVAAASMGQILLVAFIATRLASSRRRGLSIRMQVFIALAGVVFAFAFGLGLMVLDRIEARAQRFALNSAQEKAQVIALLLSKDLDTGESPQILLARKLPFPSADETLEDVSILDAQHHPLVVAKPTLQRHEQSVEADVPIFAKQETVGYVRVIKSAVSFERLLEEFAPTVLVITLLLGAVAALAAAWIGRTIAEPIETLSRFADDVSGGSARAVPPLATGREVMRLTRSIESMRRQLEGRPFVETFAADLSHELKNPVAAIRAAAEVLDEGAIDEPEVGRRFVGRIREAIARIERLLSDLLSLARIEARGAEDFPVVDLGSLVESHVVGLESAERVLLELEPQVHVRGDVAWLGRAIANLIDNALFYSQGPVTVTLTRTPELARLQVSNPGEIDPHTRSRIFSRFVTTRADKGGTGLGLAIVRAVAEAHRGGARLESAGPPDVRFSITVPLA